MTEKDKGTFKEAILSALDGLAESGVAITKAAVIINASYKDGKSVGESTLYLRKEGKKGKKGVYVHADLHKKIDAAKEQQRKGAGKSTKKETIVSLKRRLVELRAENSRLVDAVVTQESDLKKANSRITAKERTSASYESEIYILASLVDQMCSGALEGVSKIVIAFETKERGSARLEELESDVEELLGRITNAKTASLVTK